MSILKHSICLLALLVIFNFAMGQVPQGGPHTSQGGPHTSQGGPHISQGGPHENQGRGKRQVAQDGPDSEDDIVRGNITWTACDFTVTPKFTCQDCNTRIICLPVGGKVIPCDNVNKPHCNNGFCSAFPSAECSA